MKKKTIIIIVIAGILVVLAIISVIILMQLNDPGQTNRERGRLDHIETAATPAAQPGLNGSFSPLVTGKTGTHVYYTDNVFKDRNLKRSEEKELRDCLEQADRKLDEDILVVGWCRQSDDNRLMFNAYQYFDGVVVPEVTYRLTQDGSMNIEKTGDTPAIRSLDTSGMTEPEELFPVVDELAVQHESELNMDQGKEIYVVYNPEYDVFRDELYYYFRINDDSRIRIDAKTGDILEEYYFNGEFID
ncbi:MAG: hypothetical protein IKI75_11110 [Lachnospiraceae bacterium]|nr:hypothetical protein [Lachnospiraceae bacterium]